ncbi:L-rhamnose/proton symporter RhaT [Paenibacillus yonginensis]|uniref:L-rhamnose/proton symporter RhaT n=1 Tax=Paenibacillus yonginensis TaxID=1462996 RepID=UPI000B0A5BA2|nr:L-rhamnose/proton symporter RhaT [Paenibacillus yonginensis]
MIYGFLLLLLACGFQGSFGLGMKKYRPFSWEAFWVIFSVVGILLVPLGWTWLEVPDFMTYVRETPGHVLASASFCGLLWGVSSILFGKAIDRVGVSLTYGVNMGISASVGSLIPLLIFGNIPVARSFVVLLIGMAVMLAGVAVITKAGLAKEKSLKTVLLEQVGDTANAGKKTVQRPAACFACRAGLGSYEYWLCLCQSDA